ncbi:carbonic anhydrase [Diutina catenulata]
MVRFRCFFLGPAEFLGERSHFYIIAKVSSLTVVRQFSRLITNPLPTHRPLTRAMTTVPFALTKESTKEDYLKNNRYFVESVANRAGQTVFEDNAKGQSPHTLWIGCSDSRAGDQCLHALPGEVFSHRNVANVVSATDISSQCAVQFAVDVLKVKKIIVCGHTDCGGVWASLSAKKIGGVLDLWLNPIRQVRAAHLATLNAIKDPKERSRKLAELNVINSVTAVKRHPSAAQALKDGEIEVWGMMYDVATGLLQEVEIPQDEYEDLFNVLENPEDHKSGH